MNLFDRLAAQSLGHPLCIVAGRPPSKVFGHLLEGSLCEALPRPGHALFQRSNLVLARLDESSHVELSILEGLGARLHRQGTSISLYLLSLVASAAVVVRSAFAF